MNNKNVDYKVDYKKKYKELKVKLKSLIYENETYQEQLKKSQDEYLQVTKDRDYLLNRLLAYESVSDDSTCTDESDTEIAKAKVAAQNEMNSTKKKKLAEPKKRAVKLAVKRGRPNSVQSQKPADQQKAVKQTKGQSTLKAAKVTTESQQNLKNPGKQKEAFVPALGQFETAASIANLVGGSLNYQQEFDRDQDRMFADESQKLLFAKDANLNNNLAILPVSRSAELDSINLDLNLDNLHANLNADSLAPSLANEMMDALTNNLTGNLNSDLNSCMNSGLNGNLNSCLNGNLNGNLNDDLEDNLSDGLNCLNAGSTNLHSTSLDNNLNFENLNFESQSSQTLLIKP